MKKEVDPKVVSTLFGPQPSSPERTVKDKEEFVEKQKAEELKKTGGSDAL